MPMWRSIRVGGNSALSCLGSLFSFIFQNSPNPGFDRLSFEIFGSVATADERWASPPEVLHSAAPRPNCAWATPRQVKAQAKDAVSLARIARNPFHFATGHRSPEVIALAPPRSLSPPAEKIGRA